MFYKPKTFHTKRPKAIPLTNRRFWFKAPRVFMNRKINYLVLQFKKTLIFLVSLLIKLKIFYTKKSTNQKIFSVFFSMQTNTIILKFNDVIRQFLVSLLKHYIFFKAYLHENYGFSEKSRISGKLLIYRKLSLLKGCSE